MIESWQFWAMMAGGLAAAAAGIAANVLQHFPRHELEEYCRRRERSDLAGEILDGYEQAALGVESLQVLTAAFFLAAAFLWRAEVWAGAPVPWSDVAVTAAACGAWLVATAVWVAWAVVELWSAPFLYYTWPLWRLTTQLTLPIRLGAWISEEFFRRLAGQATEEPPDEEEEFADEIRSMVTEGSREGLLDADARKMIERVMELGDSDVADIMRPRSSITAVPVDIEEEELFARVAESGRTRIPVYDKTLDHVIGILYVKDLLHDVTAGEGGTRRPLREIIRPARFVPETKRLDDLLREFLRTHSHLAIALDEYGGVAGLVTLEDLLEQIVGDIVDESDRGVAPAIHPLGDGAAEASGRAHIGDLNAQLGVDLPEEDDEFDTIGGLVMNRLGRIPRAGDTVECNGIRIVVTVATARGVDRVRLEFEPATRSGV